jgi:hypothetical protein
MYIPLPKATLPVEVKQVSKLYVIEHLIQDAELNELSTTGCQHVHLKNSIQTCCSDATFLF